MTYIYPTVVYFQRRGNFDCIKFSCTNGNNDLGILKYSFCLNKSIARKLFKSLNIHNTRLYNVGFFYKNNRLKILEL